MKKQVKILNSHILNILSTISIFKCRPKVFGIISLTIIGLYFPACKKFVQIGPPKTLTASSNVFSNNGMATSAMTTIYQQMFLNGESFVMAQQTGLLGDELTGYSLDPLPTQLYGDNMIAGVANVSNPGPWTNAYSYIYQANAVIEGLATNNGVTPSIKEQLTGEAKFVRAFWNFYLTNLYGDIPLVTSTDYVKNQSLSRAPQADVYKQIIVDLKDAQASLSVSYVDASNTASTTDRVRPNKAVATALLARVYLFTKDYSNAATQASSLINNTVNYSLNADLKNSFLVNNSEAIWQLATPLPNILNTKDGEYFILKTSPNTSGNNNSMAISPQLLNSFETGDQRKNAWLNTYINTSTGQVYYYPFKYKTYDQASPIVEYTTVIRLSEMYLIRAESLIQNGDLIGGTSDLNTIRKRAGLNPTTAFSKNDLINAVLHERQVELFTEWGHRWLDMKRTGVINDIMSSVTPAKLGNQWSSTEQLYPIPLSEITLNSSLIQNPGY